MDDKSGPIEGTNKIGLLDILVQGLLFLLAPAASVAVWATEFGKAGRARKLEADKAQLRIGRAQIAKQQAERVCR